MTRRRRAPAAAAPAGSSAPVDPDVALFAARVRAQQERERAEKRAARDERHRAGEHERLLAAKDAAAGELKRLRRQDSASAEQVALADAAYRSALAALLTHETGQAPAWAPAPAPEPDPSAVPDPIDSDPSATAVDPDAEDPDAEDPDSDGAAGLEDPRADDAG
ncbi:MAG: hypothetical protein JWN46_2949 [Acidimicrobiales bacterium]|nr:hypothetical protein [Acidimicrobiales bacterium]